jgi:hypothetical protein
MSLCPTVRRRNCIFRPWYFSSQLIAQPLPWFTVMIYCSQRKKKRIQKFLEVEVRVHVDLVSLRQTIIL